MKAPTRVELGQAKWREGLSCERKEVRPGGLTGAPGHLAVKVAAKERSLEQENASLPTENMKRAMAGFVPGRRLK